MSDVVISLFFVALLAIYLFRRPRTIKPKVEPLPPFPIVSDAHFEEKLALTLRALLARTYSPEHASAHTAREISAYAPADPLVALLTRLEAVEYTSKRLDEAERSDMLMLARKSM